MATPIGTNTVTAIARRWIMPTITDNVYGSNPVFFRLHSANRKIIRGGTQLEVPVMHRRFAAGGPYQGFDKLTTTPSDTTKNAAYDWRQYHVPVSVDGLTLIKTDSPDAIANFLDLYFEQARMEMIELLATGLWSDGTNPKDIDGLEMSVDDGTVATTYGGFARAGNTFWSSQVDSTTATLTLASLQSMHGATGKGGRHASLIASRQGQYNRFWNLVQPAQRFPSGPGLVDEQLAQAGFHNLLFNGTPWVVDDHVFDGPNANNSAIVFLNEAYYYIGVSPRADFYLSDFQTPTDQDAMVANMFWAGNLLNTNCQRQGKLTAITA